MVEERDIGLKGGELGRVYMRDRRCQDVAEMA